MSEPSASPNAEAIEVWSQIVGPKFIRHKDTITRGFEIHGVEALRRYPVSPGEHVLDVGCGFGDASVMLARAVGPEGRVVGFDCTPTFLEHARADAAAAGVLNVEFRIGDAQTHPFEPIFDRIFSRFGTMFFSSAVAALRNLRRALRPAGLLTMVVWRARDVNDWVSISREVVLRHIHDPAPGPTCGPGPFSMAEPEVVTQQLLAAGYADLAFHPIDAEVRIGASIEAAVNLALELGPAGELMRLAGAEAEALRPRIVADLAEAFVPYEREDGVYARSRSWCVAARSPA